MLHVAEINSFSQLKTFRPLWNSLEREMPNRGFSSSFEFFEAYWHSFGSNQKLRALIVAVADHSIGIVPFVVKPVKTRLGVVNSLTYPLDGYSTHVGPIGPNPAATLYGAFRHLKETPRDWEMIDLRGIDDAGQDHGRTANAFRLSSLTAMDRPWDRFAEMDLTDRPDRAIVSLEQRLEVTRQQLAIGTAALGPLRWIRRRDEALETVVPTVDSLRLYQPAPPRGVALKTASGEPAQSTEELLLLAEAGWEQRPLPQRTFLRTVAHSARLAGACDLSVLLAGNTPLGSVLCTHEQGRLEVVSWNAQPSLKSQIAEVLCREMLVDSIQRGDTRYALRSAVMDLTAGVPGTICQTRRYTHFGKTAIAGQVLRMGHWGKQLANSLVASVAPPRRLIAGQVSVKLS